jgi:hypothetical protein
MTTTPSREARPAAIMTAAGVLTLLGLFYVTIIAWLLPAAREVLLAVMRSELRF